MSIPNHDRFRGKHVLWGKSWHTQWLEYILYVYSSTYVRKFVLYYIPYCSIGTHVFMSQEEISIILFVHCKTHFCVLPLPIQSRYSIWRPQKQLSTVTRRFVFCFTRTYRFSRRRHQLTKSLYFNNITTPFEAENQASPHHPHS